MKQIQSAHDLSVFGAPPAFSEVLHVGRPNLGDRTSLFRRFGEILDNRWLSNNGPMVQELERQLVQRLGVRHCIPCCNGTVAIEVAVRAMGLGGEVIVPSYTFVATAHALRWLGLTPVFADIDPATHNLDPADVERRITPQTTGVFAVHLWGRAAPVDALQALAERRNLSLFFDAAHAFGCTYRGRPVGGGGRCEIFSFHATKFFNTFEGGAIATNDDELAARIRLMINFGFSGYDNVASDGTNGKMTEVCAAMGLTGLESLDEVIAVNRRNDATYRAVVGALPGLRIIKRDECERSNYQYVVMEVDGDCPLTRDEVVAVLHAERVLARKYFWPGIHRMPAYRATAPRERMLLPQTEAVADRVVVLPTGTAVDEDAIVGIGAILRVALNCAPDVRAQLTRLTA